MSYLMMATQGPGAAGSGTWTGYGGRSARILLPESRLWV